MASVTPRGDIFLAQVRIKQGGAIIFSESKVFESRNQAESWGERLEAKVKSEGPAKHASSKTTVGELVRRHLKEPLKAGPGGHPNSPTFGHPEFPHPCASTAMAI